MSERLRRRSTQPRLTCCAFQLEDKRQRDLFKTGIAGTQQLVEQADDNAKKTIAQRRLNEAQLDQQKAALAAIDIQEKQLRAQIHAAEAQVALASDNLRYTRILSPADGLVGQRQVPSANSSMSARK